MGKHRYNLILIAVLIGVISGNFSYSVTYGLVLAGVATAFYLVGAALIDLIDARGDS